ncbi:MAG TPA: tetratricopeptide repeat protein [Vicinamibacterales bacterium]|nr:tetratricopeptide repeat protein [Vicinamibacterales bacterium]
MSEARIGRLLVASLHQAISDILPDRLEFYENWLNARGLRRGTIGLAAVSAVLSFLRGEGEVYADVVRRAGQHAADWTLIGTGRARRTTLRLLPRPVRVRLALSLARRVIRETYADSRAIVRIRRGVARVELRGSLFCEVREPGERMLCGFYLALAERLLDRYDVPSAGVIEACRAVGGRCCGLAIRLGGPRHAAEVATAVVLTVLLTAGSVAAQTGAAQPTAPPAGTAQVPSEQDARTGERLLVVPFENPERDPALFWLTEGAAILLADATNDLGASAITRSDRVRAFDELHLPAATVLSRATVIKVGQLVGASRVVVGNIQRVRRDSPAGAPISELDELIVRARGIRLDTGRLEPEIVERAPLWQLFELFQRTAARLVTRPLAPPLTTRVPLAAFESYVKGLLADNSDSRVRYLEAALASHPRYNRAHLALWDARTDRGEFAQALAAARAVPEGSPLSRRARFLAALSLVDLKRFDDAFEAFKVLNTEGAAAALQNNLGVLQLRRGWTAQTGKPAYYFDLAIKTDPNDPDSYFNLGYAYALDDDPQAAIYWLRETVRRNTADAEAHFVLGAVLRDTGSAVEAGRETELARHLSASYEDLSRRAAAGRRPVPAGLERLRRHLEPFQATLEAAIAMPMQRDQREMAAFHLDRGRRLVEQQHNREAITELRRTIYLSPYNAEAHLLLGRVYLRTGRVADAIGALKISIWSQDTVPARVALGEAYLQSGDVSGAREQADRALALAPDSADAKRLRSRIP